MKLITHVNREKLKQLKRQRRDECLQRIPIECKYGKRKSGYQLNYVRAKLVEMYHACYASIFLVRHPLPNYILTY